MINDDVIWEIINNGQCSFKTKYFHLYFIPFCIIEP